jgi:limonene-1,2-epoxide hydrolase
MNEPQTPAEVAVAFVEAFARNDMDEVARHIADDIVFESPRVTVTGAEDVLAAIGQFARAVIGVKIIAALGDGEQALIMYDMETRPFGTMRAADHLVIRDGKIKADALVFDTYELRKAMEGEMEGEEG